MRNVTLVRLVLALAVTAALAGQTKILVLKDGRRFSGEVTEIPAGYRIKTKHAVLEFSADKVASITTVVKPEDEYEQRLAKIDPKDARARLSLGQWAYKKGLLKIAKKEFETASKLDPELEMAILSLRRVNAELSRITRLTTTTQAATGASTSDSGPMLIPEQWLVSTKDIYRIRIAEFKFEKDRFDLVDTTAAVTFRNDVIERFINMMQGKSDDFDARKFRAMSAFNKLKTILAETEQESIRKDILLGRDCVVMREFRTRIWPILVSRCGALTCHGAAKGQGQFKLLNVAARNDRIDYSNFMILSQYSKGRGRMLDRDNAAQSLLLHHGLPLDDEKVKFKHPSKKKLVPAPFAGVSDKNYRAIEKWIGSLRGPPYGGNYDVKYQAPYGPKPQPRVILDLDVPTTKPVGG